MASLTHECACCAGAARLRRGFRAIQTTRIETRQTSNPRFDQLQMRDRLGYSFIADTPLLDLRISMPPPLSARVSAGAASDGTDGAASGRQRVGASVCAEAVLAEDAAEWIRAMNLVTMNWCVDQCVLTLEAPLVQIVRRPATFSQPKAHRHRTPKIRGKICGDIRVS